MDPKDRSPSFLGVKMSKTNTEKNSTTKTQRMTFKPMPSIQLLQSLNMYIPEETPSSAKKLNMKPARTNELNLDEFKISPKITTKNVRKQLWSVEKGDSKWTGKGDKFSRVTAMKPGKESLRKSVYSRPTMIQPKKITTNKQTKCLSMDDTLPLMDLEQFTVSKIKRTLFSAPQSKPLNQRKTSHINVNKMQMISTFAKKMSKPTPTPTPTPTIVITPAEKNPKKSVVNKIIPNKPKIENEKKTDKIDLMFDKISNIEDKISSFDDIKGLLCTICVHLGIEVPVNFLAKQQKPEENEQISINKNCFNVNEKREISSPCLEKDVSSTILPKINENVVNNTEFKETVYKLSPFIKKETLNLSNETNDVNRTELKLSPCTSKVTTNQLEGDTFTESKIKLSPCFSKVNSQLENNEIDTITETNSIILSPTSKVSIHNLLEKSAIAELKSNDNYKKHTITESKSNENCEKHTITESESNENYEKHTNTESKSNENCEKHTITETKSNENCDKYNIYSNDDKEVVVSKETPLNLKDISPSTTTKQVQNSLKPEYMSTPNIDYKINTNIESTIKLKKTWITQFEQLENKLLNNTNESVMLNSSPDNSPIQPLEIDKIVNDDDDEINALKLKKSQSTSNLLEGNASHRKNILFKSKETDLLTESICVYNKLRDELPKLLSTPVNKTNKTMNFMTPSVQGNEKKLISRRVQEQLLRLNDC